MNINNAISQGFDIVSMGHAYRINGIVDLFHRGNTVYDKKKNEYHKFKTQRQAEEVALMLALKYGKHEPFKKLKSGRMSIQEFRHIEKTPIAEYDHWKNDKQVSDDFLYFICSGSNIKIGRSKNPQKRLLQLKTGTPELPILIYSVKNKGHMETVLHKCFAELRRNGEWFYYGLQIQNFIKWLKINC